MKKIMHCSINFRNPFSSVQDIAHGTQPDKHHFPKLQQTPVRAVSDILCDRWKHGRGPVIVGGQKKNVGGWLQIVILRYLVSCCRFMNQKSGQAQIPQSRWDISALSFSSHSGSTAATRLFFLLHSVSFLTFHLFGPSLPSVTAVTPWSSEGAKLIWLLTLCF